MENNSSSNIDVSNYIKSEIQLKLGDKFSVEIDKFIEYETKNKKFGCNKFDIVVRTGSYGREIFFVGYLIDNYEFINENEEIKRIEDDFPFPILLFNINDKSVIFYKNVKEDITGNESKYCDFNLFLDVLGNNINLNDDKEFTKKVLKELEDLKTMNYECCSENFELKNEIKLLKSEITTQKLEVETIDNHLNSCIKKQRDYEQITKNYEEYCKELIIDDLKLIFQKNNINELIKEIDLPKEKITYNDVYRGNEKIYRKISTIENNSYGYFFTLYKNSLYARVEIYNYYDLGDNEISRNVCNKILFYNFEKSLNQFIIFKNTDPFLNDFVWVYIDELQ
ncbi:hypothetical protein [Flavobacterium sp.]|jgi:hypothetical protein|uniref:hypothetical protein n=1 Tax=Flavobacterium sp. TaxID=239 RepID=UPI0037C12C37